MSGPFFAEHNLLLSLVSVLPTLIERDENRIFHLAGGAGRDAAEATCLHTALHSLTSTVIIHTHFAT